MTLVVVAGILGHPSPAMADDSGPSSLSVRLDYQVPADCPTAADFTVRLTARSPHLRLTADDESAPKLVVRVTHGARGRDTHGALSIRYADGNQAKRAIDGDTCESVVDALALMSAMALDPSVAMGGAKPDVVPPVAPEPPVATVQDAGQAAQPVDMREGTHVSAGAGGGIALGIAPVAAPDVTAFIEIARTTSGLWSPSVRASFDYANSGSADVPGGGMRVARSVGVLDGCPLQWSPGSFRIAPCLVLEGGILSATGLDIVPAQNANRPWLAAGALGRVRYVFLSRIFVEVSGGLRLPLVRDTFFFKSEPSTTIFEAPAVSGFADGALGITIL